MTLQEIEAYYDTVPRVAVGARGDPEPIESGHLIMVESITRALVRAARSRGVSTAFLSAGSDEAASVCRAVGFEQIGTACILEVPGG